MTGLLDAIRARGSIGTIRKGFEPVLQALIEAEAAEVTGASHYDAARAAPTSATAAGAGC